MTDLSGVDNRVLLYQTFVGKTTRVIGLAFHMSEMTYIPDQQTWANMLLEYFRRLIVDMHSDYFVPRIIRFFSGERFPSLLDLQDGSVYEMWISGERSCAMYFSGVETGYVMAEKKRRLRLKTVSLNRCFASLMLLSNWRRRSMLTFGKTLLD